MFKFNEVNDKVADEALKFIEIYRKNKEDNIFDAFYRSHLDCFESLIEDWKSFRENYFAVICEKKGHKSKSGIFSPVFATVCKRPNWDSEGIMLSRGVYGATKFEVDSKDLDSILKFIKDRFPNRDIEVMYIDKALVGSNPKELWADETVRGDFDETGCINSLVV